MTGPFANEGNGELESNATSDTPEEEQAVAKPGSEESQVNPTESMVSSPSGSHHAQPSTEPTTTPTSPTSTPTMPPPGAPPAGQAPFGVMPGVPTVEPAFGQGQASLPGGWIGSQVQVPPHQTPQGFGGQPGFGQAVGQPVPGHPYGVQPGSPGVPTYGAYPTGGFTGSVPSGQVPLGTVPPSAAIPQGSIPSGQMPQGGFGAVPPTQPKSSSPLPWIILAAVLSLGLIALMAVGFLVFTSANEATVSRIDASKDTLFSELVPSIDHEIDPSDITSLPSNNPVPNVPSIPPIPDTTPASDGIPFTVPDPSQIQGDVYHDLDRPAGLTASDPVEMAVGENKEGKVLPEQMVPVRINLTHGQKVTIGVKGEVIGDYRFWVTSPANELVGYGDDSLDSETNEPSLDPRIQFEAKTDGVHTVLVNNSFSMGESTFTITVNE